MGFFDFLKGNPSSEAILSQVRKAKEPYAQPDYRRAAMDKLLKWDTDESLRGLLERFSVVIQSPHWDEEEKSWLVEEFVNKDKKVIPILKDFILQKNEINRILEILKKILKNDEEFCIFLIEALNKRPPIDHRSIQAKEELIKALSELKPSNLNEILLPYLNDHSDDVQCAALDALALDKSESVKNHFLNLLSSEVHSDRVLRKAAKIVSEQKIKLLKDTILAQSVSEEFHIKNDLLMAR